MVNPNPDRYENHYSQSKSGGFALLHRTTMSTGPVINPTLPPQPYAMVIETTELWDVDADGQLGAYVVRYYAAEHLEPIANSQQVTACRVVDSRCGTEEEWEALTKPYLSE